ncbi:hypothetical protein [Ectobacillus panaciterrae]|uniref:hypothetical protein n=1 Tax=Ectobacillus panaciterrae TaxID=363872 RepID=UPI0003F636F2|nr:hypothetical protein [Ectobacillus panaciterrae]
MKKRSSYNSHAANQLNYQLHHQMLQQGYKKKKSCNCGKRKKEQREQPENQDENK